VICCGMAAKRMGMFGVSVRNEGADCEDGDSDSVGVECDMLCILSIRN